MTDPNQFLSHAAKSDPGLAFAERVPYKDQRMLLEPDQQAHSGLSDRVKRILGFSATGTLAVASLAIGSDGNEKVDANALENDPLPSGTEFTVDANVSEGALIIGNLTVVNQTSNGGFAAAFGGEYQNTSTQNVFGNMVRPNAFIANPGSDGEIGIRTGGASSMHTVVDSVAEITPNEHIEVFDSPIRIKDTRNTGEIVRANGTIEVEVGSEYAGKFAIINLTVDGNNGPGWQATYPCSEGYQGTSSINAQGAGGAQAIMNMVKVDENGKVCVLSQNAANGTIIDFLGTIDSEAAAFQRRVDTRISLGVGPLQAGVEKGFEVGEPNSVFVGTIVSTNPSDRGWVAAYTESGGYNGTSTLNSDGQNTAANFVVMRTDSKGRVHLLSKPSSGGSPGLNTDIVIDGTTIPELEPFLEAQAARLVDSRAEKVGGGSGGGSGGGLNGLSLTNSFNERPILPENIANVRCEYFFSNGFNTFLKSLTIDFVDLDPDDTPNDVFFDGSNITGHYKFDVPGEVIESINIGADEEGKGTFDRFYFLNLFDPNLDNLLADNIRGDMTLEHFTAEIPNQNLNNVGTSVWTFDVPCVAGPAR